MGIGAQDSFELAQTFIERTGIESFPMYWDPGFDSWVHFGIRANSDMWLVDANGNVVGDRFYRFDQGYVEDLLDSLS